MDLLKKITGDDKPEATSNPVATEADTRTTKGDADESGKGTWVFDKLKDALDGDEKPEKKEEIKHDTKPELSSHGGLLDKIGDALGGEKKQEKKESIPEHKEEPKHESGLLDKISGALTGQKEADKKGSSHEESKTEESRKSGGLLDKISDTLGGEKKEEKKDEKKAADGLMDKVNNALGGGQKGEKKEDGLDKAVDWVQEHVLGQGSQKDESAVEQAKDEAISDTIRKQYKNATGHEFPIADK